MIVLKSKLIILSFVMILVSCKEETKIWQFAKSISLEDAAPIGITHNDSGLWISDGDNNRIIQLNTEGEILNKIEGFSRPMHLSSDNESVYIPVYGEDKIIQLKSGVQTELTIQDSLDAPAAVDIRGSEIAIADFYNHRILYFDGSQWTSLGKEGKKLGEFYYPTDVQITEDKLYVADAYNNRIQVWNKTKQAFEPTIGANDGMNATTGIYVSNDAIYASDFENDRVLIFELNGELKQILDGMDKPTDMIILKNILYITNYKSKEIRLFELN